MNTGCRRCKGEGVVELNDRHRTYWMVCPSCRGADVTYAVLRKESRRRRLLDRLSLALVVALSVGVTWTYLSVISDCTMSAAGWVCR